MQTVSVELDRVPVAQLIQKYSKTKLYTEYFKKLGITPIRDGLQSYVSPEQADLVDQYHQARGMGKEYLSKFLSSLNVQDVLEQVQDMEFSDVPKRSELVLEHSIEMRFMEMLQAIALRFAPTLDPLARADALAKCCRENLILRTSEVKQVIGVAPRGDRFLRDGFAFVRMGQWGREVSWRVERI
jgi:hypothetical protein